MSLGVVTGLNTMASNTPARFNTLYGPEQLASHMEKNQDNFKKKNPLDLAWQIKALLKHDIYALPGASANIARLDRSSMLTVTSKQDVMVNPKPAMEFAASTQTGLVTFDSDCGHYIFQCEYTTITALVSKFLEN
jgi:homoserine O-acetyltransferase